MDKKKLFDYIDSHKDAMVATLCELIAYPSYQQEADIGAPFGRPVRECLDKALEICEGFGFRTKNYDGYVGVAEFTENEASLGILGHLDVVPEGTGWTHEPFNAHVCDGKVFGRGSIDDKGPCVAVMYAMKAIKDLGIPLKNGVRLILGTNEENGSGDLEYFEKVATMPKWLFTPDGNYPVINIEKGMIRAKISVTPQKSKLVSLHSGKTINAVPELANATVCGIGKDDIENAVASLHPSCEINVSEVENGLRIDVKGTSAHASTPDLGDNALTCLLAILSKLNVCESVNSLATMFPYGETDGTSAGIKASDEVSGSLTEVLSVLDYDGGEMNGWIDIRFPVCENVESVKTKLEATAKTLGLTINAGGVEPHYVKSDSAFVQTLLGVYEEMTGEKGECIAIGGGTYVHHTEGGVAFGAEFPGEDNHMHGADEFMTVDSLLLNAKMFALALINVCNNEELK